MSQIYCNFPFYFYSWFNGIDQNHTFFKWYSSCFWGCLVFKRLILRFLSNQRNIVNRLCLPTKYWGNLNGIADVKKDSLEKIIVVISALPHKDKGKVTHLLRSSLIVFNNFAPFTSNLINILWIGDTVLMPRYFLPCFLHTTGVADNWAGKVMLFRGIASLLVQFTLYPEKWP